ncbi:MAG: peptide deformylase [Saccharofermentans sp.]|nr:peptide deformylase [Saccharofermentans sp.]
MVHELMHDPFFLGQKSEKATQADVNIGRDLMETLAAHRHDCVGMAANMIGLKKCIIAFTTPFGNMLMYNPVILKKDKPYDTEEGCLSLLGGPRPVTRYEIIEVEFQDVNFKKKRQKFTGFTAEIIQHEVDHCNGILI